MKHILRVLFCLFTLTIFYGCGGNSYKLELEVIQTNADGDHLAQLHPTSIQGEVLNSITLFPEETYQVITGFGGAFTESSAHLLNKLSIKNRREILEAYFGNDGARYSLTRTHMNSCDFSLNHYSYASVPNDSLLLHFSIQPDLEDIIPMILEAQKISTKGFKIIASPWTAPPWMKDNNSWYGGKLKPESYATWALFFSKYASAYKSQGIDIWAFTIENEPLGNDSNWESMHFTPQEMADFVKNNLGPQLKKDSIPAHLFVYDQNKGKELEEWANALLSDRALEPYIYGTAVHWYNSTIDWYPNSLQLTHKIAPQKHLLQTEGCIDAEIPHWNDDKWYWQKEATDWGYDWAEEEDKKDHPKYVPVYRYAKDIIGCLNNWVEGWVDWNMVLDQNGGPNLAKNWCVAPVLADIEKDSVYYTPMYYVISHFSRYISPGAVRIGFKTSTADIMITAVKNPDGSIVAVILNPTLSTVSFELKLGGKSRKMQIGKEALQTILIK